MKNILLVCAAGMSTSMVVKKMQQSAENKGIEAHIWAVGENEYLKKLEAAIQNREKQRQKKK